VRHRTELDDLALLAAHGEPVAGPRLDDLVQGAALEASSRVVALRLDDVARRVLLRERALSLGRIAARERGELVAATGEAPVLADGAVDFRRGSFVPATTMVLARSPSGRRA
jgi:hypothetical protein